MAKTWANEAPEQGERANHAPHPPSPPPVAPGLRRGPARPEGARYRPDFTTTGDRVDFDRVMLETWRPKAVRPQTDPFYVPGPGSEPPPIPEMMVVEPLSRAKLALVAGIAASALIVVASGAYLLGRSASVSATVTAPAALVTPAPTVGVAPSTAPRVSRVDVGPVTVEPLPAVAPMASAPVISVAVAPTPAEPRIRPLAAAEPAPAKARPHRARRSRRATAMSAPRDEPELQLPAAAAAVADDAGPSEPTPEAAPAPEAPIDEPAAWQAPRLAGWDEVVAPSPVAAPSP